MTDKSWLSFSIGPVQSFISTARTVRDLWTGSYLLSWLTAQAARSANLQTSHQVVFLEPDLNSNPIFRFVSEGEKPDDFGQILIPTLPNRFIAELDSQFTEEIIKQVKKDVMGEWEKISNAVRMFLNKEKKWDKANPGWDEYWDDQTRNFWDIRLSVLPVSDNDVNYAESIGFKSENLSSPDENIFKARMFLLARLDFANKQIKHYPSHEKSDCHLPKCALCGERSQQIPRVSSEQWKELVANSFDKGERLHLKDRFCAVELVKRFAWEQYFSKEKCFKCNPLERRVWDTYTIAASGWLSNTLKNTDVKNTDTKSWLFHQAENSHQKKKTWNGQWLSWRDRKSKDLNEADDCPEDVWNAIKELRLISDTKSTQKYPPGYYAILMLDGDEMGKKMSNSNRKLRLEVSTALAEFSMKQVPKIIEEHSGQLIYAGGDDILAMLPRETAIQCANNLSNKFHGCLPGFTLSGGLAVVHVKHDLRDALNIARNAEKKAKDAGRNRLAISIVKRSGEAETATIQWDQIELLDNLREQFTNVSVSDRWMYRLTAEWDSLSDNTSLIDIEFHRLLEHSQKAPKPEVLALWPKATDNKITANDYKEVLTLMQYSSFLARSKED